MSKLNKLTRGKIKGLLAMFGTKKAESSKNHHPFVGKFCLARCYAAGVHTGVVISVDGENVILEDSHRLWDWQAQEGIALSGVAQNGLAVRGKIDVKNPEIYLTGVCELIPCSEKARGTIIG